MEEIKKIETSVDDDIEVKMDNIQQEILERKKKKRNVIIFGAEESKKSVMEKRNEHDLSLVVT